MLLSVSILNFPGVPVDVPTTVPPDDLPLLPPMTEFHEKMSTSPCSRYTMPAHNDNLMHKTVRPARLCDKDGRLGEEVTHPFRLEPEVVVAAAR